MLVEFVRYIHTHSDVNFLFEIVQNINIFYRTFSVNRLEIKFLSKQTHECFYRKISKLIR